MDQKPETVSTRYVLTRTLLGLGCVVVFLGLAWMGFQKLQKQPKDKGTPQTLRKAFEANEKIFSGIFSSTHLSKTFPKEMAAKNVRVNGKAGLTNDADTLNWKLNVIRENGDTLTLDINDIKALPKTEIIFDFKCIEGWSQITHWGGVKFSDFVEHYKLGNEASLDFVSLVTPDKKYYVGIDMPSMMHPQTILCYEMNEQPLPLKQGYPLRLIIPVKYGVKHIKRIGTISFSNTRPRDYWYEFGYDYYCGL